MEQIARLLPDARENLKHYRARAYETGERARELEARARRLLREDAAEDMALRRGINLADARREITRQCNELMGPPE